MTDPAPQPAPPLSAFDSNRPFIFALAGLVVVLGLARTAGEGGLAAILALAVLVGVPLVGGQLTGTAQRLFFLIAALGGWLVFRPQEMAALALPGLVLHRVAYFAVPPLVLGLALADHDRERLKLGWAHLYAPAVIMALGSIVHLFLRWGAPTAESEIRYAAAFYAAPYAVLIVVGLLMRLRAPDEAARPAGLDRAEELEEQGRFGLAAQVYERQGQVEKGARAAERAGDWVRAGRLYRRAGDDFNAGEMYSRAQMWTEALDSYESARAVPAAARLCAQLGQVDRAVTILEGAGLWAAVVQTLEQAGRPPTPEQYRKAGKLDRAARAYEQAGDFARAAEIYEHDVEDVESAIAMHLRSGSFVQAGRLLEAAGRKQEALEAFAASPAGALDAARLFLAAGRTQEAADVLARLPPASLEKLEDETTLTLVARVMVQTGRVDEAARILQGLKRKGTAGGTVRLLLGQAFLAKHLHELAEEELRAATSMPMDGPDELQAAYLLGCVLEETKKYDEAAQVFHDVLQKDLQYADAQERYRRVKPLAKGPKELAVRDE
jgi:tetratricopeptide (TPR) repeat protein